VPGGRGLIPLCPLLAGGILWVEIGGLEVVQCCPITISFVCCCRACDIPNSCCHCGLALSHSGTSFVRLRFAGGAIDEFG
jgi:hypothetical protein